MIGIMQNIGVSGEIHIKIIWRSSFLNLSERRPERRATKCTKTDFQSPQMLKPRVIKRLFRYIII